MQLSSGESAMSEWSLNLDITFPASEWDYWPKSLFRPTSTQTEPFQSNPTTRQNSTELSLSRIVIRDSCCRSISQREAFYFRPPFVAGWWWGISRLSWKGMSIQPVIAQAPSSIMICRCCWPNPAHFFCTRLSLLLLFSSFCHEHFHLMQTENIVDKLRETIYACRYKIN